MKKFLFLGLLVSLMTSCIISGSESGTSNPGATIKTITVSVSKTDWRYTNIANNNYFYVGLDLPEITQSVFDRGEVKAYLVVNRNNYSKARKHLLPYVMHKEEYISGNWVFWTETIDFTYGKGWCEFNIRASDFAYELDPNINPEAVEFDIVITKP